MYDMELENEVTNVRDFMFGGNSEFTIKNLISNKCCKYKIKVADSDENLFFVRVMKRNSYEYAGCIRKENNDIFYKRGFKGELDINDEPIRGLFWSYYHAEKGLPKPMVMLHHGRCASCGRRLDDDLSVLRGFGPVCWKRLGYKNGGDINEET